MNVRPAITAVLLAGVTACAGVPGRPDQQAGERDAVAVFGLASLEYERGDDAAALDGYLNVVESAARGQGGPWAPDLASAAAGRLGTLFTAVAERAPREDRLLGLQRGTLPWLAQLELAEIADGIARKRGSPALLQTEAHASGCVSKMTLLGTAGRLPHLDLAATWPNPRAVPAPDAVRLIEGSGCRLTLPALDGHPGTRVLSTGIDVPARGAHDVVIDFAGPALVRVDGGPWHEHGSRTVYGPRLSSLPVKLTAGRHTLEVRLGTYGGTAEFRLFVLPHVAPIEPASSVDPAFTAMHDLVLALNADAAGDTDGALTLAGRLSEQSRFAVGLSAAAAIFARDVTRPSSIARDAARALWTRAVAVDARLARPWRELAAIDLGRERPQDAAEQAEHALHARPGWWPAALALIESLKTRGLERDADKILDGLLPDATRGQGICPVLELAFRRAERRTRATDMDHFAAALAGCDAQSEVPIERMRAHGDLAGVAAAFERLVSFTSDIAWARGELASAWLAAGRPDRAVTELESLAVQSPRDAMLRLRLVDALRMAGEGARADAELVAVVRLSPGRAEVRQAARLAGLPLPLDAFRLDGAAVIRDFSRSGRHYDAPSVLVLDRTVGRLLPDGAQLILTHNIVLVQGKEGIERWGEIQIPEGAEVLTLRTHKPDGSVREPEDIAGKATISAADLAVGDFIEWETIETRDPSDAFAPGFLGERFYFQSLEAPLDRSEYLVVVPEGTKLDWDRRADAPAATWERGPEGTQIAAFRAHEMPQLFAERAPVSAIEWIPSVRVSSGVSIETWGRFLTDELLGQGRASPALRTAAQRIAAGVSGDRSKLPAAIARFVTDTIEPDRDLFESATSTLARGRGNRAALMLAVAHVVGIQADLAFVRSPVTATAQSAAVVQQLDDFADVLVRFQAGGTTAYVDPRLRHAPFGYLPSALDGGLAYVVGSGAFETVHSSTADNRSVNLTLRLDAQGAGTASVTETLTGWPALEWAETLDRTGEDKNKLRQEFEQLWLSHHFSGARLDKLSIDLLDGGAAGARLAYTFSTPPVVASATGETKFAPAFFRTFLARRYATENRRRTALLIGTDVPLDLQTTIELPPGARVIDPGADASVSAGPRGEIHFVEKREVAASTAPRILLHRQVRVPLVRIPPAQYEAAAVEIRRVDPIEQGEIRMVLPGSPPANDGRKAEDRR